ncbi:MAG TPA: type II toxin-antitoxin system VapC family toxin [Chloroflexota bacterium]|nr:type II toxin-antitoxin system VapC family toxin [Chloroflexota bacterium]
MVTDASLWVSWLLPADAHHLTAARWLQSVQQNGTRMVAPWLLPLEVAGAIARRTGDPDLGTRATASIIRSGSIRLIVPDKQLWALAARIAADARLRGADALYVATAYLLGLPLVTFDAEQARQSSSFVSIAGLGSI